MPHLLPPEDENSPASPHASEQPAAGWVAADVPDEQNPAGGPKEDHLPGTSHHQMAGEDLPAAAASDVAAAPVIEDGKATAPKHANKAGDVEPTGVAADAASADPDAGSKAAGGKHDSKADSKADKADSKADSGK